jgi:hypothetical protein
LEDFHEFSPKKLAFQRADDENKGVLPRPWQPELNGDWPAIPYLVHLAVLMKMSFICRE